MNDRTNTIFGWILGSGIVVLGLASLSSRLYHSESPEEPGYFIDAPEEAAGADSGPPLAQLLAEGDAAAGEQVFAKCVSCHTINSGGQNGIGPNLFGVLGKPIGQHVAGFAYSDALSGHGGDWSYENMDAWLKSPRAFANGTKMSFAGLGKAEDRANVILYLRENGGGPALPEFVPGAEGGDEAGAEGEAAEGAEDATTAPGATAGVVGDATPEAAGAVASEVPVPAQ